MEYNNNFSVENIISDIDGIVYTEKWEDVLGIYKGMYQISIFGRIKSLIRKNRPKEIILKSCPDKDGYCQVVFWYKNIPQTQKVHVLVAKAFIQNPQNKPQVNHKNGKKNFNFFKNLEWATNSENQVHARKAGLNNNIGEGSGNTHLTNADVIEIFNSKLRQHEIASKYQIGQQSVSRIKTGVCWGHITQNISHGNRN